MSDIRIPPELLRKLWLAIPDDPARRSVAMATQNRSEFEAHLRAAGYDPAACDIGRASLASAEFVIDWTRVEIIELAPRVP